MSIEKTHLPEQHYVYVSRSAEMNAESISSAMGSGFGEVFGFLGANQIQPLSMPMTLYTDMPDGAKMVFRAGVMVSAEDAAKASGEVKAGTIPAGDVVTKTHIGAYANMNQSHKEIWDHCDANGYTKQMPIWEIYVDDPTQVPEASLKTQLYRAVS